MAAIPCCVCMQALHDVLHGCDVAEQDVFMDRVTVLRFRRLLD
jgi:hypothetical protein